MGEPTRGDVEVLVHLTTPEAWADAQASGALVPDSLEGEGFVHLCRADQLTGVVDRYYRHLEQAVVLVLDAAALGAPLRWEPGPTGERFPHLYGAVPVTAVVDARACSPAAGDEPPVP